MQPSRLIIPEVDFPVGMEEFSAHLNGVSEVDSRSDLAMKLASATSMIEESTGRRQLCEATWELRLENWPSSGIQIHPHRANIVLDIPQVSSIVSIAYTDNAGVTWTLPTTEYKLINGYDKSVPSQITGRAEVELNYSKYWPTNTLDTGTPISVRYVAGWKDADSVPFMLKGAILLEAAHLYRDRESVITGRGQVSIELDRGVSSMIAPYTAWRF